MEALPWVSLSQPLRLSLARYLFHLRLLLPDSLFLWFTIFLVLRRLIPSLFEAKRPDARCALLPSNSWKAFLESACRKAPGRMWQATRKQCASSPTTWAWLCSCATQKHDGPRKRRRPPKMLDRKGWNISHRKYGRTIDPFDPDSVNSGMTRNSPKGEARKIHPREPVCLSWDTTVHSKPGLPTAQPRKSNERLGSI